MSEQGFTYVMGGIYGYKRRFEDVMQQINLKRADRLYILGDALGESMDGLALLVELMQIPNVKLLLGLQEVTIRRHISSLMRYGEVKVEAVRSEKPLYQNLFQLSQRMQKQVLNFINRSAINVDVRVGDTEYLLVYGAPMEACPYEGEDQEREREFFALAETLPPDWEPMDHRVVVSNGAPTEVYQDGEPARIWYGNQQIAINCAMDHPSQGRLCCLRLDDGKVFYSQN